MNERAVLIIIDGLGDRPVAAFDGRTPLEWAPTPNLDRLAAEGACGLMSTLGLGRVPGSDVAHLSILGYDLATAYTGRGPIEVAGLGMRLEPGDIALRGNLGTVDDALTILDRRAGRITDVTDLVREIDGVAIEGVRFIVRPGTAHRAGIIMRGAGLSARISDADPHVPGVPAREPRPLDDSPEAARTCEVLAQFLRLAHARLGEAEVNRQRAAQGLPVANYLLVRGAGRYEHVPSFESRYGMRACVIAGAGLYKGIGAYTGMTVIDVPGATGLPDTDIAAKYAALRAALETYAFAFVHIKAADSLGEDGNHLGKARFIERIDAASDVLLHLTDTVLVITGDHSTPCSLARHSADPVPILFRGPGVRVDEVPAFGERPCSHGGMGRILGREVMPEVMNLLGLAALVGA